MLHSTNSHWGQGKGLRVGKSTHRTATPNHLLVLHNSRPLPTPSTTGCELSHQRDITGDLSRRSSSSANSLPACLDEWTQVHWADHVKRPPVCTLRFHSTGLFPKRDIWGQSVAKAFVLKVERLLWPTHLLANPLKGRNLKTLLASRGHRKFGFKDQKHKMLLCVSLGWD